MSSPTKIQRPSKISSHVVALTGGIGSGKSAVRTIFEELGIPCIDADIVAREIHQDPQHPATERIINAFPNAASSDGKLKRGSLSTIFAVNGEANKELKRILKPYVMADIMRWTLNQTTPYVVWESALIMDENIRSDRVLVVDAANETRIERILKRNPNWTREQINAILDIQLPRCSYRARADDVVCNEGSPENLRKQVEALHDMYIKYWSK